MIYLSVGDSFCVYELDILSSWLVLVFVNPAFSIKIVTIYDILLKFVVIQL